jgi:predicted amidohydrolase
MRVASIQMSVVEGDKEKTIAKALENISKTAERETKILTPGMLSCFGELGGSKPGHNLCWP